jgi:hypothetical protein
MCHIVENLTSWTPLQQSFETPGKEGSGLLDRVEG